MLGNVSLASQTIIKSVSENAGTLLFQTSHLLMGYFDLDYINVPVQHMQTVYGKTEACKRETMPVRTTDSQ